ncbi:MAG: RND family transporter [Gammaproteobacteria bacterium]|nr:MMPL family transporter [Gammaproteobacteria bacterium]RZO96883.1 MAG: RND family transporter [Gammaproteobacteria bacterium]|tara:strand:+ start:1251 stop:3734 length:2484 start_codon:yes stop_codon:yes gene_type:complete
MIKKIINWQLERPTMNPFITILVILTFLGFFSYNIQYFELDASSDSLLLQDDEDLRYYRNIKARYGDDEFLVVTISPKIDLFDEKTIDLLTNLKKDLSKLDQIESVVSILDVPLLKSPPKSLAEIADSAPTFLSPETDKELAKIELTTSNLYRNLIISEDAKTTAMLLNIRLNVELESLIDKRDALRAKRLDSDLSAMELKELDRLTSEVKSLRKDERNETATMVSDVRSVLDQYKSSAEIFLGGVPMITVDMIDYIQNDIQLFGLLILMFLVIALLVIFKNPQWMIVSMVCCLIGLMIMTGVLGYMSWPVTVVSANFVALLLIFSLSITVHLTVRYRELVKLFPEENHSSLIVMTMRDKLEPCLFTTITTMVGFGSLLIAGIRPVIDFGWMMLISMGVIFILVFNLFPALLSLFSKIDHQVKEDKTHKLTNAFANLVIQKPTQILILFTIVFAISISGITKLTAENQFIKAFKEDTEIFQGLSVIDSQLGGTTPLDIIIEADPDFFNVEDDENIIEDDFFDEAFFEDDDGEYDIGGDSYWYNSYRLKTIEAVHDYLESLNEAGKVISFDTTMDVLQTLNDGDEMDTFFLSVLYKKVPDDVKEALFDPYLSEDGNQLRISFRVYESYPDLQRGELLKKIKRDLTSELGLKESQVKLTGMLVLYNNVLESLITSQILTIGFVFAAIMIMFLFLFRSIKFAVIAVIPSIIASSSVLGLMGLMNIPLDIMTITIAAICIGIGVDHSIHYVHRFREEILDSSHADVAIKNAHNSTGQAIYYTSVIIILGFSILAFSNFIPTIYFGLFTAFAMLLALFANLTLLPVLLMKLR